MSHKDDSEYFHIPKPRIGKFKDALVQGLVNTADAIDNLNIKSLRKGAKHKVHSAFQKVADLTDEQSE